MISEESLRKYRMEMAENQGVLRKISDKRAEFAALAMQGLIASRPAYCEDYEEVARDAVKYADELVKELNKHV